MEMYFGYPTTLKKWYQKKKLGGSICRTNITFFPVEIDNGTPKKRGFQFLIFQF